jgi:hypothetical protein
MFVPILNQHNYFSWSNNSIKTPAQICLQYTLWTLAISASAQHQAVGNALYLTAKQSLEDLENDNALGKSIDIVRVQAWLLLSLYEFVRVDFQRGWMSAGRAFRLIQLMKLHELDFVDHLGETVAEWVATEERRRTFWFAFSLDQFVCLSNGSPLTLTESVVRIPSPAHQLQKQSKKKL